MSGILADAQAEADFYAKFVRFQIEVLNGQRPEYKLRQTDTDQLLALHEQAASPISNSAVPHDLNSKNKVHTSTTQDVVPAVRDTVQTTNPLSHQPFPGVKLQTVQTAPQIDPILLAKSDNLVKAEARLKLQREQRATTEKTLIEKRQSIEQTLKKCAQTKAKFSVKDDLVTLLGYHAFDGDEVLKKALAIVKPASGRQTVVTKVDGGDGSKSESSSIVDGYYSSKGNSWSSELSLGSKVAESTAVSLGKNKNEKSYVVSDTGDSKSIVLPRRDRISGLGPKHVTAPGISLPKNPLTNVPTADITESSGDVDSDAMDTEETSNESYSPPDVDALGAIHSAHGEGERGEQVTCSGQSPSTMVESLNLGGDMGDSESQNQNNRHKIAQLVGGVPIPVPVLNALAPLSTTARVRESESYSPPQPRSLLATTSVNNDTFTNPPLSKHAQGNMPLQNGYKPIQILPKKSKAARLTEQKRSRKERKAAKARLQPLTEFKPPDRPYKRVRHQGGIAADESDSHPTSNTVYEPARPMPQQLTNLRFSPIKTEVMSTLRDSSSRRLFLGSDGVELGELSSRVASSSVNRPQAPIHEQIPSQNSPIRPTKRKWVDPNVIWIDDPEELPPPSIRRRIDRPPPDLRRVASLQRTANNEFTQHLPYPIDDYRFEQDPTEYVAEHRRSQSAILEQQPTFYDPTQQYHSSPLHKTYANDPISRRQLMPPPPRPSQRIFVDEHGEEYIAIPTRTLPKIPPVPEPYSGILYDSGSYLDVNQVRPSHVESAQIQQAYAYPALHPRANSRPAGYKQLQRRQPQVIDLTDDDDDDSRGMSRALAPLEVCKRPYEATATNMQSRSNFEPRVASVRAASLQALPSNGGAQAQHIVSGSDWYGPRRLPDVQSHGGYRGRPGTGL